MAVVEDLKPSAMDDGSSLIVSNRLRTNWKTYAQLMARLAISNSTPYNVANLLIHTFLLE